MKTSDAMIYFFGLWLALTVAAFLLSRHLRSGRDRPGKNSGGDDGRDDGPERGGA